MKCWPTRPLLLDLFCGAGGAAMGYHRAGFDVLGVDIKFQPRYPFRFVQAEALGFLERHGHRFDAIHASPPCQQYSRLAKVPWIKVRADLHPKLIGACRSLLLATGKPWVIENVADAPLTGFVLCGQMFGLPIFRHRRFECSFFMIPPAHKKHRGIVGNGAKLNGKSTNRRGEKCFGTPQVIGVYGHQFRTSDARKAMECHWMNRDELRQAIPPAYTEYLGRQLIAQLQEVGS